MADPSVNNVGVPVGGVPQPGFQSATVPFGGRGGGPGIPKPCWRCGQLGHRAYECTAPEAVPGAAPMHHHHHHHHHAVMHNHMGHHMLHQHHAAAMGVYGRGGYGMVPRGAGVPFAEKRCYICAGPHLARECPQNDGSAAMNPFRGRGLGMGPMGGMGAFGRGRGGARGMTPFSCYNCGSTEHASANCDRPRQCRICNSSDGSHLSYNCPQKPQKSCRICGSIEHLQAQCPQAGAPRPMGPGGVPNGAPQDGVAQ